MSEQYTYAVARVRAMEDSLFSDGVIEQLINCKDESQAITFLEEKGWGGNGVLSNAEKIFKREEEKTWETVGELKIDLSKFDVLSYPKLFHNLKAAIKAVGSEQMEWQYFYKDVDIERDEMMQIIQEKAFDHLPAFMQEAAEEATETFLRTKDGQLCDVIIDKAALDAMLKAGKESKERIIETYAETTVAVADIKIAVRSQMTNKALGFVKRSMAECDSLNIEQLSKATQINKEAIIEYLSTTIYKDGAEALKESPSAFERWCDNRMIQAISPEKTNPFTIGPIFAYVIARENEIKTVRIILSGIRNGLSEESIRERVRQMYV
ncbi:MAG: V0D/AC39 family V-type ATPase subunit [Suipraeoptans sp.]